MTHLIEVDTGITPELPIKERLVAQIKANRDHRKLNGVEIDGQWIHTDTYSRTQWLGMVTKSLMGLQVTPIPWVTMDGTPVTTTIELAHKVVLATEQLDLSVFAKGAQLEAAVLASDDPETIDIVTGWPKTFGE